MTDIQAVLKRGDIEATLTNNFGESHYLGKAITVRPLKNSHHFRFKIESKMKNLSPFNHVVLHTGNQIIDLMNVKPFFQEGRSVLDFDYGRA